MPYQNLIIGIEDISKILGNNQVQNLAYLPFFIDILMLDIISQKLSRQENFVVHFAQIMAERKASFLVLLLFTEFKVVGFCLI